MKIAFIKKEICENVAEFETLAKATEMFPEAVVVECPEGFGIGDSFDGEVWTKAPEPNPAPEPESDLISIEEALEILLGGIPNV